MADPVYMFKHALTPLKGWPSPYAVDYKAKLSSNVTIDPMRAGRVVHLNSSGEFETGVTNRTMAIFLLQSSNDPDVKNDGGAASTFAGNWVAVSPSGALSGLVAIGAYELETTEFDTAQTYNPNDTLTATNANTNATTGGRITNQVAVPYTNPVCGVVSRGKYTNAHGVNALAFWPVYLPVA